MHKLVEDVFLLRGKRAWRQAALAMMDLMEFVEELKSSPKLGSIE